MSTKEDRSAESEVKSCCFIFRELHRLSSSCGDLRVTSGSKKPTAGPWRRQGGIVHDPARVVISGGPVGSKSLCPVLFTRDLSGFVYSSRCTSTAGRRRFSGFGS